MIPSCLGVHALRRAYDEGCDPIEVAREVIGRRDAASDAAIWITPVPDASLLERAETLAADRTSRSLPLFGIPFAIKDNIDAAGLQTSAGCPAYARQARRHAVVVERLLAAGAMLVGKTNLDQFATGLVGTRSPYGAPRSVFSREHVSGGSSSGSAVAVASGLVSFALGTDTAGSGRVPAAFNGIVGLKPTRGLISTRGVVPACRSLDCVSIFARDVRDARSVATVACGYEPDDPWSRRAPPPLADGRPLRVGVLAASDRDFDHPGYAQLYDAAIARAASLGLGVETIDFAPFRDAGALLYGGAFVAERTEAVGDFVDAHPDAIDPTVRRIIAAGRDLSAADLWRDQHRLLALARAAEHGRRGADILLLPTVPGHPRLDAIAADPIGGNARLGLYTNFVNLLDMSAIAIPAGLTSDGLPFGVTLAGPACSDAALAEVASAMEETIPIVVAGAHLSGMKLNHELANLGGTLRRQTRTAPLYALYALSGTRPPKPALVRTGDGGASIEVEIWDLSPAAFGRFVAAIPPPLGIGKVMVDSGESLPGFICEASALDGALDITAHGGWRAWQRLREDRDTLP